MAERFVVPAAVHHDITGELGSQSGSSPAPYLPSPPPLGAGPLQPGPLPDPMPRPITSMAYAIPTWNRAEAVVRAVAAASTSPEGSESTPVLVHVDGSTDGTEAALREVARRPGVDLHLSVTSGNVGYGGAVLALLRAALPLADAVVLCADDDLPLPAGLPGAASALDAFNADMLSTPVPRDGRDGLDRRPPRTRRAAPPELRAVAAHAPGIVLRTAALDGALDLLAQRLERGCAFARAYPQAVVATELLARGRVWWWSAPLVMTGADLPTGIRGVSGETYASARERWEQWRAFQDLLAVQLRASSGRVHARYRAIRSAEEVQLLPHLRAGLCAGADEAGLFDRAARRTYRDGSLRRGVRWGRSLGRTPERAYLVARAGDLIARGLGSHRH